MCEQTTPAADQFRQYQPGFGDGNLPFSETGSAFWAMAAW
jgi:hypothetical protein